MPRSRLAQQQKQRAIIQILVYLTLAVAIGAAAFFFIIPQSINFFFNVTGGSAKTENTDTIPPQVPILAAPPKATKEPKITITGYGESGATLVLLNNSQELGNSIIKDDGSFSFDVPLSEGDNQLTAYSRDTADNTSANSKTYTVVFDNKAPELIIEQPKDGAKIELRKNQNTTVAGKTQANAKVFVNGRLVLANSEGAFSTLYQLKEGSNEIALKAEDEAGNTTEQKIIVNFRF